MTSDSVRVDANAVSADLRRLKQILESGK